MIRKFRTSIDERTKGKVHVTSKSLSRGAVVSTMIDGERDPLLGEQFEKPRSDAWIEAMVKFRDALKGLHDTKLLNQPPRIRVSDPKKKQKDHRV